LLLVLPRQQQNQVLVLGPCIVMKVVVDVMYAGIHPSFSLFIPPAAFPPLLGVHHHHAVNVQAILRTLIAQKLGMVRQYKVMVAEVVSVLLVEGVHMMVVAVATGARVRVVLRENIIHPCCV